MTTCKTCGADDSLVIETRHVDGAIYRRRRCKACGERWATVESAVDHMPRPSAARTPRRRASAPVKQGPDFAGLQSVFGRGGRAS